MQIPHDQLQPDTLRRLLEEIVTRDGTETSDVDAKVAQVRRALERGEAVITYDEESESCSIVPTDPKRR